MPLATLVAIGVLCAAAMAAIFLVSAVPDEVTTGRREAGALLAALVAYSLFYGVLNERLVHHRQHLFGAGFGGWQKACTETRYWKNCFRD
mgnify:CR=1 FL=1